MHPCEEKKDGCMELLNLPRMSALMKVSTKLAVLVNNDKEFYTFASMKVYEASITNDKVRLTGGNWQKWKRVFLTCPCHEIYRDEAVGLKSCKNTWKITIFVKMWNLG